MLTIFRLGAFRVGEHLTIASDGPAFGRVVCTDRVVPRGAGGSRIVVKVAADGGGGVRDALARWVLPPATGS